MYLVLLLLSIRIHSIYINDRQLESAIGDIIRMVLLVKSRHSKVFVEVIVVITSHKNNIELNGL